MVHSSVLIILFLRIILLFRRMISFKLVAVACLLLQPGLSLIQMILSRFSGFSFIVTLLNKIKGYSIRTEYNPVSYTHLDVYKRQIKGCFIKGILETL